MRSKQLVPPPIQIPLLLSHLPPSPPLLHPTTLPTILDVNEEEEEDLVVVNNVDVPTLVVHPLETVIIVEGVHPIPDRPALTLALVLVLTIPVPVPVPVPVQFPALDHHLEKVEEEGGMTPYPVPVLDQDQDLVQFLLILLLVQDLVLVLVQFHHHPQQRGDQQQQQQRRDVGPLHLRQQ